MDSAQAEKLEPDPGSWREFLSHPVATGLCLWVSPAHPRGSEDRVGLSTLPPAGMKEPPARPFAPTLRCQHPWRRPRRHEELGTVVAKAPTGQEASRLTDQQTSLHSFFLLSPFSLATSLAEDREHRALKSPKRNTRAQGRWTEGGAGARPPHPTPSTYKTRGVRKPPRQSRGLDSQDLPP